MKDYLITGGCGFIGSNFVRFLLDSDRDCRVTNLDALTYAGNRENLRDLEDRRDYQFVEGSITDRERVYDLLSDGFDVVVHFAAESHVDRSLQDQLPFVVTNLYGTQVLLQAARSEGVDRFVHVSTDEVYGSAPGDVRFDEDAHIDPSSPYAASKAGADHLVNAYVKSYGFPAIITRSTNNFGPYQYPEKFIPLFTTNALDGEPLPLYGDGTNVRDWLYVIDHCRALAQIADRGEPGRTYNIGANCEKQNREVAQNIVERLDAPEDLIEYVTDRPGHDQRYALDCTRLREEIGWEPEYSFDRALARTVDWYRENRDWWEPLKQGEFEEYYTVQYDVGSPDFGGRKNVSG